MFSHKKNRRISMTVQKSADGNTLQGLNIEGKKFYSLTVIQFNCVTFLLLDILIYSSLLGFKLQPFSGAKICTLHSSPGAISPQNLGCDPSNVSRGLVYI